MSNLSPTERSLRARHAALTRWSHTDSAEASEAARRRQLDRYEHEVDPDGLLDPAERTRRADRARKAHMADLARRSAKSRRLKRELAQDDRPDLGGAA
ncbi:hypothetical protein [Iamia sp.]|uniref:hypothetical protein n=1 Tax=Iamia sp. TaxID=2722710 RepID=UPI002C121FED|nr:hypothetical protein [Iamia sp.]HXH56555.1 hypothetical protein [Iamia sp.]